MTDYDQKADRDQMAKIRAPNRPSASHRIGIKRAYEPPSADDGLRILIDRLWPRGITKTGLKLDCWPRALAPSAALRKWYDHDPQRFAEFRRRYQDELAAHRDELAALRALIKGCDVSLITATRELDLSHARVLREVLEKSQP